MKKAFVSALLGATILFSCGAYSAYGEEDPVVAKLGDKKILLSDFNRWVAFGSEMDRKSLDADPKMKAAVLRQIVTSMAIAQAAKKEGFDQRPEVKENMELFFNNFLTVQYLDKVVAAKVAAASEEELKRKYEERKKEFEQPEKVRARHILIKVERDAPEDEIKKAREKADGILKKITAGENFAKLAEENSDDPGSKKQGGDLGFFARDMMAVEFEDAAFALKPAQVSDIVQTDFGFHIIKLEERKEPSTMPYEEVKDRLRKKVDIELKRKAVDDFVEKISKDAGIEIDSAQIFGGPDKTMGHPSVPGGIPGHPPIK